MRAPVETIRPNASLAGILDKLREPHARTLAVTDPQGTLVGLLTRQNLGELMMIKLMRPDWRFRRG
jgi:CBS domain-containing protein